MFQGNFRKNLLPGDLLVFENQTNDNPMRMKTDYKSVEEYITTFPENVQEILKDVRDTILT